MEENEAYKEMDLLDSVSSLGGRVVRKTGELKDLLRYPIYIHILCFNLTPYRVSIDDSLSISYMRII